MRLFFFTKAFLPVVGGAELFLDQLAGRLAARGHDVTVLCERRERVPPPRSAYRIVRYSKSIFRSFFPSYGALALLREHFHRPPDCVHAHGGYPAGPAAELFGRWTRKPFVVRPMGFDVLPGELVRSDPAKDARMRRALARAARVVAQSAELEDLIAELGVPRARIVRIPNAVDVDDYQRPLAVRSGAPTVAALGILHPKKGFDVLLEAFARVRERVPAARLALAGDGEQRTALEARAARSDLAGSIEFAGMLAGDAKVAFLQRAWIFVSASRREPFSNANLEALAAGLPLVATAVGGNREMVEVGVNGLLVPPEDPLALASAIERVLADERERMGAASLAVARRYAWDDIVGRYERLYAELVC